MTRALEFWQTSKLVRSWLSVFETIVCSKNKFLSFFAMRSKPLWHLVAILSLLVVPAVQVLLTRPKCDVFQSAIARKMSAPNSSTVKLPSKISDDSGLDSETKLLLTRAGKLLDIANMNLFYYVTRDSLHYSCPRCYPFFSQRIRYCSQSFRLIFWLFYFLN